MRYLKNMAFTASMISYGIYRIDISMQHLPHLFCTVNLIHQSLSVGSFGASDHIQLHANILALSKRYVPMKQEKYPSYGLTNHIFNGHSMREIQLLFLVKFATTFLRAVKRSHPPCFLKKRHSCPYITNPNGLRLLVYEKLLHR